MKKSYFLLALVTILSISSYAQKKPKLIVGVVIDQFRYDLLTKFKHNFSENGFNRIIKNGFFAENMHYNYMPTYTGPGHSTIFTGTVPAIHGIVANNWIQNGANMYCTQDDSAKTIGSSTHYGKMSPENLLVSTIGDEMRQSNNFKSQVVGIALKDRGAILSTGHMANEAYWYDAKEGKWITSDYYMNTLPDWLEKFNQEDHITNLMKNGWELKLDSSQYMYMNMDNAPWEESFDGHKVTMPYYVSPDEYKSKLRYSPFGNTYTNLLAMKMIEETQLGEDDYTDLLVISYSSTDYVGHAFGPNSLEIEDTYYRLDEDIANLLEKLDYEVGKDNYWLFITGDHGVQSVPGYANFHHIHSGLMDQKEMMNAANSWLVNKGIDSPILHIQNHQIYLKDKYIKDAEDIAEELNMIPNLWDFGIRGIYSFEDLSEITLPEKIKEKMINGFYPRRSGHLSILVNPGWMSHKIKGTTHGSPYSHDTHVPFLFYGSSVQEESSSRPYDIIDIAPTIAYLLGILEPNGCIGRPIIELEYLKSP